MTSTPETGNPMMAGVDELPLARDQGLQLLRAMLRVRRFEERCVELYSATKIRGFMHLYIGEEAVAAGVMAQLAADDTIVATYREHGHALLRGLPMRAVMAEMFGKEAGCSHGRGGSMHFFDVGRRFYGGNAIVGGGIPWRSVWPWPIGCRVGTVSQPVFSAKERSLKESSTNRPTLPHCGSCPSCSVARTTCT